MDEDGAADGKREPMAELVEAALDRVEKLLMDDPSERYTETGLAELDESTGGGLHPGDVMVIAGQAGVGKTALLLGIASHAALAGRRVALFFPSLRPVEAVERMLFRRIPLSPDTLRKGYTPSKSELKSIQQTARGLAESSMLIGTGGGDPLELRRMMAEFTPGVVVMDDFPHADSTDKGMRTMKRLAVEFSTAFVIGLPLHGAGGNAVHHDDLRGPHTDVALEVFRTEHGIEFMLQKNRRGPVGGISIAVPASWKFPH